MTVTVTNCFISVVMIWCGRDYTSKMRSVDVFKCWPFAASGLSRDEAESWLPPMSIPESRQWSDNLAGQRSNLACAGRGGERLNQPNGMISYESESEKEDKLVSGGCAKDKLVTGGCAKDLVLEEEEKVVLVCLVCQDFNYLLLLLLLLVMMMLTIE